VVTIRTITAITRIAPMMTIAQIHAGVIGSGVGGISTGGGGAGAGADIVWKLQILCGLDVGATAFTA